MRYSTIMTSITLSFKETSYRLSFEYRKACVYSQFLLTLIRPIRFLILPFLHGNGFSKDLIPRIRMP